MKKFLFSFLLMTFAFFSFAQDLPLIQEEKKAPAQEENAQAQTSKEEKKIADFASYKEPLKEVSFATPFDLTINLQKPATFDPGEQKDFEIININDQDPSNIVLTLVPFNLGVSTFTATVIDKEGEVFALPPLPLDIKKIKTKYEGQKLLDIRGPRFAHFWFLYLLLFLILLAGAIYFIYRYKKRKKKELILKITDPYSDTTKTPEDIALSQIDSLLVQDLWASGQYKMFYIFLTDIFRDYLTARFGFKAHHYTTRDLIKYLKRRVDFKSDLINPLEVFLKSSDFVKFAKALPSVEQRDRNLADLRFIIKESALPKPTKEQTKKQEEKK